MNTSVETGLRISHYEAASSMAPHRHEESSLCLVLNGLYRERVHTAEHDHVPGDLLFYPAGAVHSQLFGPHGARKIIFTPKASWTDYLGSSGIPLADAPHAHSPTFFGLGNRLSAELCLHDEFTEFAREGILLELVAEFARTVVNEDRPAKPPKWLLTARDFIHDQIADALSMEEVSQVAGKHPVHVARQFQHFFGRSIGQYQRQLRVEKAAQLLQSGNRNITDIALLCGFCSHSHLCRVFKAAYGLSPKQYRAGF